MKLKNSAIRKQHVIIQNSMKTQYRICIKHDELDGRKTSTLYLPEYRNIWTLFIWRRLGFRDIYESREKAEMAIRIHRGEMKTVKSYENFE